jgi:multicomponent K+:H+ antiporter subunit D
MRPHHLAGAVWTLILLSSLVLLIGFARAGIMVFWQTRNPETEESGPEPQSALSFAAVFGLLSAIVALTLLAQPVMDFLTATASQLHDPSPYIDQVLRRPGVPTP